MAEHIEAELAVVEYIAAGHTAVEHTVDAHMTSAPAAHTAAAAVAATVAPAVAAAPADSEQSVSLHIPCRKAHYLPVEFHN